MKPKMMVLDTYYPDFLSSIPELDYTDGYEAALRKILSRMFGTGDSYSYWLGESGWETRDIIGNDERLQKGWHQENYVKWDYNGPRGTAVSQVIAFKPDVLFLQDLSFFDPATIQILREEAGVKIVAAQCSCPWPGIDRVKMCDVIFTSFPHYADEFKRLGVEGVYSKLAFDPRILKMVDGTPTVMNNITFVGGVGYPSHWKAGLETLETISKRIPEFVWFGYGSETLPEGMELKRRYRGQRWGLGMYNVLAQSGIVINRHGEVANGYTNNMRTFEATGMGTLLFTESSKNLSELFEVGKECVGYLNPEHAADLARFYLENRTERDKIASAGQRRTLRDHTYKAKIEQISDKLKGMLA
jgi:hypothetical protein